MSKMRIYDLVKEINKENGTDMKSAELLEFLKGKGVEVKTASSSVEEDIVKMAKDSYRNGTPKKEEPKKEEPKAEGKKTEQLKKEEAKK